MSDFFNNISINLIQRVESRTAEEAQDSADGEDNDSRRDWARREGNTQFGSAKTLIVVLV